MARTMSSFQRVCIGFAMAYGALGCHSRAPRDIDPAAPATIEVQNNDFYDMNVYVLVNGQRTRLGMAPGNKSTTLTIPQYLIFGTSYLRFVCDPIGGNRAPVSEEIDVSAGDQIEMVINPGG